MQHLALLLLLPEAALGHLELQLLFFYFASHGGADLGLVMIFSTWLPTVKETVEFIHNVEALIPASLACHLNAAGMHYRSSPFQVE